jgi:hypothetical protein
MKIKFDRLQNLIKKMIKEKKITMKIIRTNVEIKNKLNQISNDKIEN